jgi:hypothetical protein
MYETAEFLCSFYVSFSERKKGHAWPQQKTFDSEEEEGVLAE